MDEDVAKLGEHGSPCRQVGGSDEEIEVEGGARVATCVDGMAADEDELEARGVCPVDEQLENIGFVAHVLAGGRAVGSSQVRVIRAISPAAEFAELMERYGSDEIRERIIRALS